MSDMSKVIIPKSDQWNADDFLVGPKTFTIKSVTIKGGQEQPVWMTLEGTEKFYRPCKGMCRVLVAVWGPDSSKYAGKSLTLYCNPKVRWAGMEVGGIEISHVTDIDAEMHIAVTVSKGKKKIHIVKPLVVSAEPKSIDYAAALKAADSMDALGKVWSSIPKAEQKKYVAVKDARKAELSQPASLSEKIAACQTVEELDALAETFSEEDVGIYFDAVAAKKAQFQEGGL